jgi:hypothetical protein
MQAKEAELIRKKQDNKNNRNEKIPRGSVEVDDCRQGDADHQADETIPDRTQDDDGALYAVQTALGSALSADNYSVQQADRTR